MPHRYTSVAIKQAKTLTRNATQGHKHSSQQAITSALNTTQGYKRSYQQAIYRFQMMGTIHPVYQNRVSV